MEIVILLFIYLLVLYGLIIFKKVGEAPLKYYLPSLVLIFLSFPFMSQDVFGYLLPSFNFIHFHLNPYQTTAFAVPQNMWLHQINIIWWLKVPFPYGPFFLLLAGLTVITALHNLIAAVYIYKVLVALAYAISILLVGRLAEPESKRRVMLLWAINPAVLINIALDGHNDIFVIVLLLLSFLLVRNLKYYQGIAAFVASILIKYYSLMYIPVFWFKDKKPSIKRLLSSSLICLIILVIMTRIPGLSLSAIIGNFSQKVAGYCLYSCSPFVTVVKHLSGRDAIQEFIRYVVFAITYCISAYYLLYKKYQPYKFISVSSLLFIFVAITWISPWYLLPVIIFALMVSERDYYIIAYLATVYSLLHFFRL